MNDCSKKIFVRAIAFMVIVASAGWIYLQQQRRADFEKLLWVCSFADPDPEATTRACDEILTGWKLDKPTHALMYRHLMRAHMALNDLPRALEDVEAAIAVAPEIPASWQWKSTVLTRMGDPEAALEAIEVASEIDPKSTYSLRRRFELLRDLDLAGEMDVFLTQVALSGGDQHWMRPSDLEWMRSDDFVSLMLDLKRYPSTRQVSIDKALRLRDALAQSPTSKDSQKRFFFACRFLGDDCPPLFPENRKDYPDPSCETAIDEWADFNPKFVAKDLVETGHATLRDYFNSQSLRPRIHLQTIYVSLVSSFTAGDPGDAANDLILVDRVFNCVQGAKFVFPEGYEEEDPILRYKHLFGPELRQNLVDLAYVLLE